MLVGLSSEGPVETGVGLGWPVLLGLRPEGPVAKGMGSWSCPRTMVSATELASRAPLVMGIKRVTS